MARLRSMRNDEKEKIAYEIAVIDCSVEPIAANAVSAALREEDEDKSLEIFESVREWVRSDADTFDSDEYIETVRKLRDISLLSGQKKVTAELMKRLDYFEEHREELQSVLTDLKREKLHAGLRKNYSSN